VSLIQTIKSPISSDPLDAVLGLTRARAETVATLRGRGDWAIRFPAPAGAKFNAVLAGSCTVDTAGLPEPVAVRAGDVFVLTRPQEFVLATSPAVAVGPASPHFLASGGRSAEVGPADAPVSAHLIGGSFTFDGRARRLLLDQLPPLVVLPAHAEGASFPPLLLTRIEHEMRRNTPGSTVVAEHLALVLLVEVLRHHALDASQAAGWLRGLDDQVIGVTLRAIHGDPARPWTVKTLAEAAHVSRSTLAARFKRLVGIGPLEYLMRWRLELAAHELVTTGATIATIATRIGYGSEAAFSLAFKRELGATPGAFRRSGQDRARGDVTARASRRSMPKNR